MTEQKIALHLLGGNRITAERLAAFYTALTSKVVTPDEIKEARCALRDAYRKLEAGGPASQTNER
jgi:hypothetical protein